MSVFSTVLSPTRKASCSGMEANANNVGATDAQTVGAYQYSNSRTTYMPVGIVGI